MPIDNDDAKRQLDEQLSGLGPMIDPDDRKTMIGLAVVIVVLTAANCLVYWASIP